jgi:hypothetical protein
MLTSRAQLQCLLALLFDPRELVWVRTKIDAQCRSATQAEAVRRFAGARSTDGAVISITPAQGAGLLRRKEHSLPVFRTVVWESDKVPLEEQQVLVAASGLPFSAAVYSGRRSIHYAAVLNREISVQQHRALVEAIEGRLGSAFEVWSNPLHGIRAPGCFRSGVEQKLIHLGHRVSTEGFVSQLFEVSAAGAHRWLASPALAEPPPPPAFIGNTDRTDVVARVGQYLVDNGITHNGSRTYGPCPLCRDEGHDKEGSHLGVFGPEFHFQCFARPEHNGRLFKYFANRAGSQRSK